MNSCTRTSALYRSSDPAPIQRFPMPLSTLYASTAKQCQRTRALPRGGSHIPERGGRRSRYAERRTRRCLLAVHRRAHAWLPGTPRTKPPMPAKPPRALHSPRASVGPRPHTPRLGVGIRLPPTRDASGSGGRSSPCRRRPSPQSPAPERRPRTLRTLLPPRRAAPARSDVGDRLAWETRRATARPAHQPCALLADSRHMFALRNNAP